MAILGYCTSSNAYQVEKFLDGEYKEIENAQTVLKENGKKLNLPFILACMTEVFNSKQVKKFKGKLYFSEKSNDIGKKFAKTETIIFKELKSGFKT